MWEVMMGAAIGGDLSVSAEPHNRPAFADEMRRQIGCRRQRGPS
jgi:hypothetical protein